MKKDRVEKNRPAEEALEKERNKLKAILDGMPDGVYISNQRNEIQYINPIMERVFGPVKGRKCFEYFHNFSGVCPWCKSQEVFAGRSVRWEWDSSKSGKIYDVFDAPIRNEDQSISKLEVLHDITAQKQTEEALRKSQKQLRYLSSQLLSAQEKERSRISRELHDELGQGLTVLKIRLGHVVKNLPESQKELKEECRQTSQYIDHLIEDTRRLSRDLSPLVLEYFGLSTALRRLMDDFGKTCDAKIRVDAPDVDALLPKEEQTTLYRILQEIFNNIRKHARARNVAVVVKEEDRKISCSIEDDGIGFDGQEFLSSPDGKGLGLAIMEERVRMMGGDLKVWSQAGRGTKITFLVPVGKAGISR